MNEDTIIYTYCIVDDFCKAWTKESPNNNIALSGRWWATRDSKLTLSEKLTIMILFHRSQYRTFKSFYTYYAQTLLRAYFPDMISYGRFNRIVRYLASPLFALQKLLSGKWEGVGFVDSTTLSVCHIKRAHSHKVFQDMARKGKTTTGWFFGLKLHLLINHQAEIVRIALSPGNTDDRASLVPMLKGMCGKVYADRGYISSDLFKQLFEDNIQLVTGLKRNMKNKLMDRFDKLLLYKRGIIECVINKLKIDSQIDHHRHRSIIHFMSNLFSGIVNYALNLKKPSLQALMFKKRFG